MDKTAEGVCEYHVIKRPPQTPPKEGLSNAQSQLVAVYK